jgi:hypothetical protein
MKNIYSVIILCLLLTSVKAQMYVSFVPCATNAIGNFPAKFSPTIEVGKQWDVFSLGFDIGKTNCSPIKGRDTSVYFEFRPNLNIFQVGKFTNTFTPGIGVVTGTQTMMIEMTSGIEYSYTETFHINMFFGQYYFSGLRSNSSVSFFGISLVKFFSKYKPSSLIKPADK